MTATILNWKISVGISLVSLLFNFAYFYIVQHSITDAIKLSASSLITVGAMHISHSIKKNI